MAAIQLQTGLAHRRGDHAIVRSRAGDLRSIEAQFGAPTGVSEAEERNRSVHWIFFLFTGAVHGGVVREILERERHADSARAHAGLFDERGALCGALCGSCFVDWREFGDQFGVGGDGLAQVGPHGRMLPRIKAEHTRDLEVDGLFEIADAFKPGHLVVIDVVIVPE